MKVFLDDERIAPEGWVQVRWPDEAIKLLQTGTVTHLSLDHDLGDDQRGTGYDVLLWIEQEIAQRRFMPPASIEVHSSQSSGQTANAGSHRVDFEDFFEPIIVGDRAMQSDDRSM